jgi:hypothetical protein
MGFSRRRRRRHCYSVFDSELTILHNPGNPAAGNEIRFHHPLHFWKVISVEHPSVRPLIAVSSLLVFFLGMLVDTKHGGTCAISLGIFGRSKIIDGKVC